jgi:lipopolysaccharide export LptBFGC system permease protein LptF
LGKHEAEQVEMPPEPRPEESGAAASKDVTPAVVEARRDIQSAASEDSLEVSTAAEPKPSFEALKARLSPRRAALPPEGDPVAFAAHIRSELQRISSRRDLQRRDLSRYAVEIQKKFAIPVAAIVFVLIGAPIGVRFPRGGIGMVIGVSLTVFSVYYVFLIGGEELADRNIITPFWAMWAPNVLFTILGGVIFMVVTRSGTRQRQPLARKLRRWFMPRHTSGTSAKLTGQG